MIRFKCFILFDGGSRVQISGHEEFSERSQEFLIKKDKDLEEFIDELEELCKEYSKNVAFTKSSEPEKNLTISEDSLLCSGSVKKH